MTSRDGAVAVSDGTMPCPVPSPDSGHPCVKKIPAGWTAEEGHAGGHWWQDPAIAKLEKRGVHYDAGQLLSGLPTPWHEPEDCTPACGQWRGSPSIAKVVSDLLDEEPCFAAYPKVGPYFRSLCNEADGHDGNHRALAVVAGGYRRYVVWTPSGEVLPDEETSCASTQGQTPPTEGDRVT